ncbi:MAG: ABC transporter ATP-binding protein [Succinivibrio sp.]
MYAVRVEKLNKTYYGKNVILNDIDLEMEAGGFTVLLGPSGCGKSTLLRMIAGLENVTSGKVFIGDKDVTLLDPKDRDIAMVFQSYALFPHMTVAQNIGFGLKLRKVSKTEIDLMVKQVADMLKIGHLLDRTPAQLSGGQRQRVAIGRALVRQPKVFLFDEPLSNLDAKLRGEMRLELKKLHTTLDTTIIYVTHDQIEAMTLATKIVVFNKGFVQQVGTPFEIYNKPANVFVSMFVGSPQINLIEAILSKQNDVPGISLHGQFIALPRYEFTEEFKEDRKVLFGIRPEHVSQVKMSENSVCVNARVVAFEKTGSETFVEFDYNGSALRAKLDANVEIENSQDFSLYLTLDNVSLFDAQSEMRI